MSFAQAQSAYIPSTRVLFEKGYQLNLGADVFSTSKIISSDGTTHSLSGNQSFTRYQAEFTGQYGLTNNLQLGLGGRFRQHQAKFENNTGDKISASGSGIQSIVTTINYAFTPVGNLRYAFEALYRYTPYTNKESTDGFSENLILGDDGNETSAGLGATYAFKNENFLTLRTGYRKPGAHLSDEVYWQAEGALVWRKFALLAGVDGVSSLNHDPYNDQSRPIYNTGTSALYNSFNREWIAPYLGANFSFGKWWRVELKGAQVVSGRSTDLGRSFGINLIKRVEENPDRKIDARFKTYDIEASVTKVSPKQNYVEIDKGMADDITQGMSMDFYEFDYLGGNVLVARGTIISVKSGSAIVKITQRFSPKNGIKQGLIGRSSLK